VLGGAVIFAVAVFGPRIEGFLRHVSLGDACTLVHDCAGCILARHPKPRLVVAHQWLCAVAWCRATATQARLRVAAAICIGVCTRIRTFTRLVDEAARLWCRSGLWYAGVDLGGDISNYVNGGLPRGLVAHVLDGGRSRVVS
jgi:hypothetical protein